jgi:hypothetical protein
VEEGLEKQRQGNLKGAIQCFQKAVERDPADYEAHNAWAIVMLLGGGGGVGDRGPGVSEEGGGGTDGVAGGAAGSGGGGAGNGGVQGPSAQVLLQLARLRERFVCVCVCVCVCIAVGPFA